MGKKKDLLSCRDVLWCLVFCGFAINYMLRINLNLTIVAMVMPRPKAAAVAQCNAENVWTNNTLRLNVSENSWNVSTTTQHPENVTYEDRFAWTEYEQSLALGAYYWLHWLSQLPGGLLARRYGTKRVFGWANLLTALFGFLMPLATKYHLYALVVLRVLQGVIAGVIWPSMHDMTAKWIPLNERSRFVSAYLGSSIGAAITYPLCAAVSNWLGWEFAFYVTSVLGVLWYIFWACLVYDSPQQHPRISSEEKDYILGSVSGSVDEEVSHVPWKALLTSKPVWITIIAQWGSGWGFLTLMTQAPTYFNFIHGWDINATGMLSGAPHVLRAGFSYLFSMLSDWLLRSGKMSLNNVRKFATLVCGGIQGVFILALGYSGCHPALAVVFMMMGTAVNGAVSASTLATFVDLSPNYASVLLGFCGLITINVGYMSPAVVGVLTNNNQTVHQWQLVYIIAAANSIVGCVVYMIWGVSDEQPWNQYGTIKNEKTQEMITLKVKCDAESEEKETNVKDNLLKK